MDIMFAPGAVITSATTLMLLDLLLKSLIIISIFVLLDYLLINRVRSNTQHLLWMNALLCLALLPVLQTLIAHAATGLSTSDAWIEITVTPASIVDGPGSPDYTWLWALYFVPTLCLIAKMGVALIHLIRIQHHSEPVTDRSIQSLSSDLRAQLGITRPVALRRSLQIKSPMSFGLIKPQIILPACSAQWPVSVMTDVLLHELSHIKRLDWLTMMLAWFVASLYWVNPLAWFAIRRLHDEAENSCDTAVLLAGRSDTDYAESLLKVAQACLHSGQSVRVKRLPAQMMLDRSTLKNRIHRILEDNTMETSGKYTNINLIKPLALMLSVSAAALFGIGGTHLVSAQATNPARAATDDEMIPLHHVKPVYPVRAHRRGIEGWVKVSFTVTAAGSVDSDSIDIVDSEPRGMFETSATRAASEFIFTPRVHNGTAVDVPNVQYMFRYAVAKESDEQLIP